MSASEGLFTLAPLVAVCGVVWLVLDNARAFARYRASLLPGRASGLSRFAWLLSLFCAWTGPLVLPLSLLALGLGAWSLRRVLRGEASARSELPARMAVRNGSLLFGVGAGLIALLWLGGRLAL